MREQERNLAAFGLGLFQQRFVFVHPYAIALPASGGGDARGTRGDNRQATGRLMAAIVFDRA